jgi:hypothetical protein
VEASVESEVMIVWADPLCHRATSISARAVSGSAATSRILSARRFRTSTSAIGPREAPDQRLVLERADEPSRVRLPV